ncbi:MAG: SIS domain-containing protein [Firmicutes bacterium]|nr:SIS domain-containing protein [Bacillota bacterium]
MSIFNEYKNYFESVFNKAIKTQEENIIKGAKLIKEAVKNDGRFYIFGTGHSHMIAEELFNRAGGLALVTAMLPTELMLHERFNKSTVIERIEGLGRAYLDLYDVNDKDVLMVVSNSGRNPVPIDISIEARKRGIKIIVMTNLNHSKEVNSRHSSNKKLYELSDVVIDNCGEKGDAGFNIANSNIKTGPTSSSIGCFLAQSLITVTLDMLVKEGIEPPVFKSSNLDKADEYNEKLIEKYLK